MFNKILIANRGAVACRIQRTLKRLGVRSLAVYSDADRHASHVDDADEAVRLGPPPAAESYLRQDLIIAAALEHGAQAIHPGYGFLSENAGFAAACEAAGLAFIGPTPGQMRSFGLKHTARELAQQQDAPLLPGSGLLADLPHALHAATHIGYPVMLKSTAGGGGIGMQLCRTSTDLSEAYPRVERLARSNFSQGGVFLEKFVERARHIEVQIFGDGRGGVVALGERDCSVQRRNQKVIEETPAPHLDPATRRRLLDCAERLGRAVNYRSAGTVEFVYDDERGAFYFLEVNTRLQVEHGVTEEVTGIDLVEWMIRLAAGEPIDLDELRREARGCAIQARLYAEDPAHEFRPSSGLLAHVELPANVRVDHWIATGVEVSPHYDPLLAKVIAHGATREEARLKLAAALAATRIDGVETNLAYLRSVIDGAVFRQGRQTTRSLADFVYQPLTIDVLQPGTHTTVQDWPGRTGYWDIGVPPSGPMDALAFRLANAILGNPEHAAGLELTVAGPTLRFNAATRIVLTGADMQPEIDGEAVPYWTVVNVEAGATLRMRAIKGAGQRAYLAVSGGLDTPLYMGSRATFTLGQFGGHAGRALRVGDVLRLCEASADDACQETTGEVSHRAPRVPSPHRSPQGRGGRSESEPLLGESLSRNPCASRHSYFPVHQRRRPQRAVRAVPQYASHHEIAVMYGPHAAPDFFTDEDIEAFFAASWEVHYNSSRTGVRLIGPKPRWARADGGEAGLHPSNIHDNAYAIGAIDFTGDMPVVLGPDGPSLGGFVCPATIVTAELWKVGQLKPGDRVRFKPISYEEARALERTLEQLIADARPHVSESHEDASSEQKQRVVARREHANERAAPARGAPASPVLASLPAEGDRPQVCYRQAGDDYVLVEYGPLILDLELRFRVHALMIWLQRERVTGVRELTPGIRSLQVHYDSGAIAQRDLLAVLKRAERELPSTDDVEAESRIVHLPLSWDDPATRLAIDKYTQSVRPDAPWCPSNIEFIRRINGLESADDVRRIVFDASYLVLGLGDVYLGAPVATPLDPRHRLVTTKYNPARTWTPENAVGIGGAYLCVYGMEGPGGYQFVGRTVQMWNRWRQTQDFTDGKQWLLRFFDQLRFYPVSAEELLQLREDFPRGRFRLRVEHTTLKLSEQRQFLREQRESIDAFKARQQAAFEAERERWRASGQLTFDAEPAAAIEESAAVPADCMGVSSPVTGSVWTVRVAPGQRVNAGDELLLIEAMKMEIPIHAEQSGEVIEIRCERGRGVAAGDVLMVIRND